MQDYNESIYNKGNCLLNSAKFSSVIFVCANLSYFIFLQFFSFISISYLQFDKLRD